MQPPGHNFRATFFEGVYGLLITFGSELGTRVAALFHSVVETCKLLDIDPVACMNEAAHRRLRDPDDVLTPHAWRDEAGARAAAAT